MRALAVLPMSLSIDLAYASEPLSLLEDDVALHGTFTVCTSAKTVNNHT